MKRVSLVRVQVKAGTRLEVHRGESWHGCQLTAIAWMRLVEFA